jgi:TniQ
MSTMTSERRIARFDLRLRSAPPHADESLSSALDRAASQWGVTRWELLRHLGYTNRPQELDGPLPGALLRALAQAFRIDPVVLASHAVPRNRMGVLLAPQLRHAYCPLCFESDWLSGTTPYFRLDWGRLWATHCRVHRTPLFEWTAINGYGDRRIPHFYYLPYDATDSLPTWMDINLKEARSWQLSGDGEVVAHDLWEALVNVERAWWAAGIGDPNETVTVTAFHSEHILARLAALFLVAPNAGQRCMAETLHIPPHQHRVLGYDRRRQGHHAPYGNFRTLRRQLPSIQARHSVLILTAHTLGKLKANVRFETGALMPPGRSHAWASRVMSHQVDYKLAQRSLREMDDW